MNSDFISQHLGVKDFYTPKEIAICFQVNVSTIYRYIESGRLSAMKLFGYRISRESVLSLLDKSTNF